MRVGLLKKQLEDIPDDKEVILGFYRKDGVYFGYLADVSLQKYDSVIKARLFDDEILELGCFDHEYCKYEEDK